MAGEYGIEALIGQGGGRGQYGGRQQEQDSLGL